MIKNMCIIPARGGSKGIPRKNIKNFGGKPLVAWTIEHALGAKSVDKIVVSTDDEEITSVAAKYGVETYVRSKENSEDDVHAVHTIIECLNFYENSGIMIENVGMLLPTSPLRSSVNIDACFAILEQECCDSVISVIEFEKPISSLRYLDKDDIMSPIISVDSFEVQRQDISKPLYEVNGSVYVSRTEHLKKVVSFHQGVVKAYKMSRNCSVDINTLENWAMAEAMLYRKEKTNAE